MKHRIESPQSADGTEESQVELKEIAQSPQERMHDSEQRMANGFLARLGRAPKNVKRAVLGIAAAGTLMYAGEAAAGHQHQRGHVWGEVIRSVGQGVLEVNLQEVQRRAQFEFEQEQAQLQQMMMARQAEIQTLPPAQQGFALQQLSQWYSHEIQAASHRYQIKMMHINQTRQITNRIYFPR